MSPALVTVVEGFEIRCVVRGRTHLVGCVPDQASLYGTLELLRDLNIELVSLNPLPETAP